MGSASKPLTIRDKTSGICRECSTKQGDHLACVVAETVANSTKKSVPALSKLKSWFFLDIVWFPILALHTSMLSLISCEAKSKPSDSTFDERRGRTLFAMNTLCMEYSTGNGKGAALAQGDAIFQVKRGRHYLDDVCMFVQYVLYRGSIFSP